MENSTLNAGDITERRFSLLFLFLRLIGIPVNRKTSSCYRSLYNTVVSICMYNLYLEFTMDVVTSRDLEYGFVKARFFLGACVIMWMHLYLRIRKSAFEVLFALTESFRWEDQPETDPDTKVLTMAGLVTRLQRYMLRGIIFINGYHIIHTIITRARYHFVMFNTWHPFDNSTMLTLQIMNISEIFGSLAIITTLMTFTCLYGVMVCVACSQLEKLRAALLDIKQETSEHEGTFSRMQDQLNACIRHHQEIKRFMQEIEDVFNPCFCGLFLIILITLCCLAFSGVMSWGHSADVLQGFAGYLSMLLCVFIYCRLGTELTSQAESVGDSAWGCDWVGTPVHFQRCLAFVIATAQKEFTLTAGKFVPVSNTTMMN
ncbi:hypothetical protein L798_01916, partial [Zootermopsis nevadensis]